MATARLVERKVLLPGVTVLARLVAQVRDRAAARLWRTLARTLQPRQAARLETLLVAEERSRQSPLERLRRAPTRVSVAGLVGALERLQEMRVCRTLGRSPTATEELERLRRQLDEAYTFPYFQRFSVPATARTLSGPRTCNPGRTRARA